MKLKSKRSFLTKDTSGERHEMPKLAKSIYSCFVKSLFQLKAFLCVRHKHPTTSEKEKPTSNILTLIIYPYYRCHHYHHYYYDYYLLNKCTVLHFINIFLSHQSSTKGASVVKMYLEGRRENLYLVFL